MIGTQAIYRSYGCIERCAVGKRPKCNEVEGVTDHGALGSENADISNDKAGEIPVRRKPEVSWAMLFIPGLVGS